MGPIQIRGTDLADRRWAAVMARWERAHGTDWSERSATGLYSRGDAAKGLGGNFGSDPGRRDRAGAADGGYRWRTAAGPKYELRYSGSAAAPEDYSRTSEPVLLDGGDREETVVTRTAYPTYRGALVVCQGGDRADVKLAVTEAVSALTGLSSDRVTVAKCQ